MRFRGGSPGAHRSARHRGDARADAGFALLEFVFGAMILTLATGVLALTLARSSSLARANRETALALEAAQGVVAQLRGEDFGEVFARFNANPADDPASGVSPGNAFAVPGLAVQPGDPDGFVGSIVFPGDGVQLLEQDGTSALGMPRDLNGDTFLDGIDHSGDYAVLPVLVRVDWIGVSGRRSIQLATTLARLGGGV